MAERCGVPADPVNDSGMAPVVYLLLTTLVWPILLASLLGSPHCAAMCGDLLRERTDRDAFARVLDLFRRTLP